MRTNLSALGCVLALGLGLGSVGASDARAQECEDDGDCPAGLGCEHGPVAGSFDQDCDGGECEGEPAEVEPGPGQCEPQEVTCSKDSDCPAGLICGEASGDDIAVDCAAREGADAGCELPEESQEAPERTCTFEPEDCESDADCSMDGFGCLEAQGARECHSFDCAGADCPDASTEPVCDDPEIIRYCFPERVDCNEDSDCEEDWRCVELPEDFSDDAPEDWVGATEVCLPEGLARAVEGTIELGSGGAKSGGDDGAAGGESTGIPGEDDADHDDDGDHEHDDDADHHGDDSGEDDDGCAVTHAGASSSGNSAGLCLLALGLLLATRARRVAR